MVVVAYSLVVVAHERYSNVCRMSTTTTAISGGSGGHGDGVGDSGSSRNSGGWQRRGQVGPVDLRGPERVEDPKSAFLSTMSSQRYILHRRRGLASL